MKLQIKKGDIYGRLTVIKEAEKKILPCGQPNRMIECLCECGNITDVRLLHLVRGRIKSCGCIVKTKKGESNTHLHRKYKSMLERCSAENIRCKRYYNRGIKVCEEWANNYFLFKKWAIENGYDKNLTIDRKDNSKGYNPENCRFVSNLVNVNNRNNTFRIKYKGVDTPFMDVMRLEGISHKNMAAIRGRILRGWNHEKAVNTPIRKGNYKVKAQGRD